MRVMRRLWNEEIGAVVSAEIMLVATTLVIGVIVGLKSVRDSVVSELADVAQAMTVANQSFFTQGWNSSTWGNGMNNGWNGGAFGSNGFTDSGMGGMGGMGGGMNGCISVCAGAWGESS
ncbi:MAG: hypothetical protein JSS27_21480 [Planctomycetes bacterium]|nr:hypothetical protein [Planctomycetota bacterium]